MTEARTTYEKLKEAAHLADVIEAAECGYIALDAKSIRYLDAQLLAMVEEIRNGQKEKLSGAATPESGETH